MSRPIPFILGETFTSNNYGEFKIVEYISSKRILIEFLPTGYRNYVAAKEIRNGCVADNSLFEITVGSEWETNCNGRFKILEYKSSKDVIIEFISTGTIKSVANKEIRNGCIRDDGLDVLICGWGINNADYSVSPTRVINGKRVNILCPIYKCWLDMVCRGYDMKRKEKNPSYTHVTVSEDWRYFMDFRRWVLEVQPNKNWRGCQIDKDLLGDGTYYSPDTCAFVDRKTNNITICRNDDRSTTGLLGATMVDNGKYSSSCSLGGIVQYLGVFKTALEAHKAWQAKKHEYACHLAELQNDPRVAKALRERYSPDKDWTAK